MSDDPDKFGAVMTPSELALAEFLRRVEADIDLTEEIRVAVAKDVKDQFPAALANLRSALAPKDVTNAPE